MVDVQQAMLGPTRSQLCDALGCTPEEIGAKLQDLPDMQGNKFKGLRASMVLAAAVAAGLRGGGLCAGRPAACASHAWRALRPNINGIVCQTFRNLFRSALCLAAIYIMADIQRNG